MAFPPAFLDELNARNPIEDVVGQYVALTRRGSNLFGLCPFHSEKTGSFSVSPNKQIYYCFGCKRGGGVVNFIMEEENLPFPDAVRFLAKRAGMEVPEEEGDREAGRRRQRLLDLNRDAARFYYQLLQQPEGQAVREYLARRRITRQTAVRFGMGASLDAWDVLLTAMTKKGYTKSELLDKSLIGDEYLPAWEKFGLLGLKCKNDEETIRAYSMANYPAEGDRIMLTVRIATPPFKPKEQGPGFMDVMPGIASSYIFTLKPGDKVIMSGPYGDFHPILDSNKEMMWIGGGAGMAPLRAQIMHLTKTLHVTDRKMSYFYGARALNEVFYLEDFLQIEKDFPNFTFHLALDRPDPAADAAGVKYTPGFVHNVIYETYLKNHEAPEDIEYYMCGPGPMSKAVEKMLDDLGVPAQNLMFDNFGG